MDAEAEWVAATAAWEQLERQLDTPIAAVLPLANVKRATTRDSEREPSGRRSTAARVPESVRLGAVVSGFARHTGGDAWLAAVGKPQLVPPISAAAPVAREVRSVCPGCSNCCFARSAGGFCTGGGHPTHPHKRPRDDSATPTHSSGSRWDAAPPAATTSTGGDTAAQESEILPLNTAGQSRVLGNDSVVVDLVDLPQHLRDRTRVFKPSTGSATSKSKAFPMAVICWTRKALRGHENPALDVAICVANRLRRPLLVLIEVEDRYAYSTARRQHFVLEGVVELQQELRERGIRCATHVHRDGNRQRPACSLAYRASLVIAEEPFSEPWKHGIEVLASGKFSAPVWLVDCESIYPARKTSPTSCHRAWQYENAVKTATSAALAATTPWPEQTLWETKSRVDQSSTLMQRCPNGDAGNGPAADTEAEMARMAAGLIGSTGSRSFWPVEIHKASLSPSGSEMLSIENLVKVMDCDHSVTRVEGTPGGSSAGYRRWQAWIASGGLRSYAATRNDALNPAGVSRMSAYLNLGMVSPFRIAREAQVAGQVRGSKTGLNKFEKEYLTWRGVAFAWCFHFTPLKFGETSAAVSIELLPAWARETLVKHARDRRERLLGLTELRAARSGDPVWDALQMHLVEHGELHNNARMGWGKAILKWTVSEICERLECIAGCACREALTVVVDVVDLARPRGSSSRTLRSQQPLCSGRPLATVNGWFAWLHGIV